MSLTSIITGAAAAVAVVFALRAAFSRSRDPGVPDPPVTTGADVRALLMAGRKIDAIAAYRRVHSVGLKTAKDAVDRLAEELGGTR